MATVKERVLEVLGDHPDGLSENALTREVAANRGVVHKACMALEGEGRITIEKQGELGRSDYRHVHRLRMRDEGGDE